MTQIQNKTHYHNLHFLQEEIKVLTAKYKFIPLSFFTQCSQKQHCTTNEQRVNANNILQFAVTQNSHHIF